MPTNGCSRDAVICTLSVIKPICRKSRRYAAFRIGYTAGITDCSMSFKKWQKLIAAKTPNAVALDLSMEEARFAGLRPVWLDTVGSLAGEAALAVEGQFVDPVEPAIHQQKLGCIDFVQADRERIASQR